MNSGRDDQYGGWMVVQRPWRGKQAGGSDGKGRDRRRDGREIKSIKSGSRFAALEMFPIEDTRVKVPVII